MANYRYNIKSINKLSNDIIALDLVTSNGLPVFDYKPGQYVMIAYTDNSGKLKPYHAFSIVSSPSQTSSLSLGIKLGGEFTNGLLNLKVGDKILVNGPFGEFVFKPEKHHDLVLIAGGIGITPFLSTIAYATDKKLNNKIALLYSIKNIKTASFLNEIKLLENKNHNFKSLLAVTDGEALSNESGVFIGRIDSAMIKNFVGDIKGKTFFICGPEAFMQAMTDNLLQLGVTKSQIEMESFSMINEKDLWPRLKNLSLALILSIIVASLVFYLIVK